MGGRRERGVGAELSREAAEAFDVDEPIVVLGGGTRRAFRAGDVVLKRLHPTSLEHQASLELFPWLAEVLAAVPEHGFRLAKPTRTRDGGWLTEGGWTAWSHVEGSPATPDDAPACRDAIEALHAALADVAPHPLVYENTTQFGRADDACWGEPPEELDPDVAPLIERLYALRQPIGTGPRQLIHGDLNRGNVLVAPGRPPAFIDFAPYARPAPFAMAMFANWLGPREGTLEPLRHFEDVPDFRQLLIRAALRMLLIVSEERAGYRAHSERRAAELVCDAGEVR